MTLARSNRFPPPLRATSHWKASICAAFALAVLGAKLWIISRYANPTPLVDDWDAQAADLFVPYYDSTLSIGQLFAAHNEHRLFAPRVVWLVLLIANGAWDPILQMIVNAAIHVGFGVCVLAILGKDLDRLEFAVLAAATLALVGVPNAIENPVWCVETNYYCLLLFGFVAITLLARESASSARRAFGIAAATLSFLSLASGAFVFLACAAVVATKRWLGVERGRYEWAFAALLLACSVLAMMLTPMLEAHKVYRAHSVGEFFRAFAIISGWPLSAYATAAAALVNAPWLVLAWRTLRRPPPSRDLAWVLLALGLWNGLQFAALAFGRAFGIGATRYIDICALNLIVNVVCAAVLCGAGRRRLWLAGWIAVIAAGWIVQTVRHVPQELSAHYRMSLQHEANVRAFLATGAFPPGASGTDMSIPYPITSRLEMLLSDPRVRRILPSIFQDPAAGERDRLGSLRNGLLRAGPHLAITGLLLLVLLIFAARPLAPQSR